MTTPPGRTRKSCIAGKMWMYPKEKKVHTWCCGWLPFPLPSGLARGRLPHFANARPSSLGRICVRMAQSRFFASSSRSSTTTVHSDDLKTTIRYYCCSQQAGVTLARIIFSRVQKFTTNSALHRACDSIRIEPRLLAVRTVS
jgi:hypothetical protein